MFVLVVKYICLWTTFYCMVEIIDSDLLSVSVWFRANKLKLNIKKSKCMFFGGKNTTKYIVRVEGKTIENMLDYKYPGIVIVTQENFKTNMDVEGLSFLEIKSCLSCTF